MTLTAADRATIEQDMVTEWEALFRLRTVVPVSEEARARKVETENRHLRELQRLSLLAARLYAEDAKLVEALRQISLHGHTRIATTAGGYEPSGEDFKTDPFGERLAEMADEALADIDSRATEREDTSSHEEKD